MKHCNIKHQSGNMDFPALLKPTKLLFVMYWVASCCMCLQSNAIQYRNPARNSTLVDRTVTLYQTGVHSTLLLGCSCWWCYTGLVCSHPHMRATEYNKHLLSTPLSLRCHYNAVQCRQPLTASSKTCWINSCLKDHTANSVALILHRNFQSSGVPPGGTSSTACGTHNTVWEPFNFTV